MMTRTSYRPLVALGLVAGLLTYVGCSSPKTDTDKASPAAAVVPPAPTGGTKEFANWPTPAGALVISGEQFGYLEPCGCTQGQLGGLKRRYDLIERLRDQQKWPLVLLDLGSLIKDPAGARGGFEQSKLKYQRRAQGARPDEVRRPGARRPRTSRSAPTRRWCRT